MLVAAGSQLSRPPRHAAGDRGLVHRWGGGKVQSMTAQNRHLTKHPCYRGKGNNWLQTIPGKGWNTILRLYGPLEPWFNKTWRRERSSRCSRPTDGGVETSAPPHILISAHGAEGKCGRARFRQLSRTFRKTSARQELRLTPHRHFGVHYNDTFARPALIRGDPRS